jgi:hypothetical protein
VSISTKSTSETPIGSVKDKSESEEIKLKVNVNIVKKVFDAKSLKEIKSDETQTIPSLEKKFDSLQTHKSDISRYSLFHI